MHVSVPQVIGESAFNDVMTSTWYPRDLLKTGQHACMLAALDSRDNTSFTD